MAGFKRCLLSKLGGTFMARLGLELLELGSFLKSGKCCQKLIQWSCNVKLFQDDGGLFSSISNSMNLHNVQVVIV